MRLKRSIFAGLVATSFLALCGCGDSTSDVSGKVTYQGKPLKGGSITFVAQRGSVSGSIKEDGSYSIAKVPTGDVKICVDTEALNPGKKSKAPKITPPAGQSAPEGTYGGGDDPTKKYMKIPEKYASPDTTDLTVKVESGKLEHNLELK